MTGKQENGQQQAAWVDPLTPEQRAQQSQKAWEQRFLKERMQFLEQSRTAALRMYENNPEGEATDVLHAAELAACREWYEMSPPAGRKLIEDMKLPPFDVKTKDATAKKANAKKHDKLATKMHGPMGDGEGCLKPSGKRNRNKIPLTVGKIDPEDPAAGIGDGPSFEKRYAGKPKGGRKR